MKDKIVLMCTRIHELEDALRKLESNASEKGEYSSSDPKSLLGIEWQDDSAKGMAPSEKDFTAEPLDELRSKALGELEEAEFIGCRSVEVCTPVIFSVCHLTDFIRHDSPYSRYTIDFNFKCARTEPDHLRTS